MSEPSSTPVPQKRLTAKQHKRKAAQAALDLVDALRPEPEAPIQKPKTEVSALERYVW